MSTSTPNIPSIDPSFKGVLIGGGDAFATGRNLDSHGSLLERGLDLTGKSKPNVLLIPSARWRSEAPVERILGRFASFFESKGLATAILHPFLYAPHTLESPSLDELQMDLTRLPSRDELLTKIGLADYTFTLGGDTHRMLNQVWRSLEIDKMLSTAIRRGAVMSGSSAGTIAWFESGQTDGSSLQSGQEDNKTFHSVDGLGYIHRTIVSPHYDTILKDGRSREDDFNTFLAERRHLGQLGLGIDNYSAIICADGKLAAIEDPESEGRKKIHALRYLGEEKKSSVLSPTDGFVEPSELVNQ